MKKLCIVCLSLSILFLGACSSGGSGSCGSRYEGKGCSSSEDCSIGGTALRFGVGSDEGGFFGSPWPADPRLDESGGPDLTGFPNPAQSSMLRDYLITIQDQTRGFGTNAAIYFTFDGAIDRDSLPKNAAATTKSSASAFLINIDQGPGRGERIPLAIRFFALERQFTPAFTMVLRPVLGFPLRQNARYAAVVTRKVRDTDGKTLGASSDFERTKYDLEPDGQAAQAWWQSLHPAYEQLQELTGLCPESIAALTVFTTQEVVADMDAVAELIRSEPIPQPFDWNDLGEKEDLYRLEGWYENLEFQVGAPPDFDGGGGFIFDVHGRPVVQRWVDIPFSLAVPMGQMPAAGWPIVIYAHGTGGNRSGFMESKDDVADKLARLGIASIGIDQPLHGDRNPWGRNEDIITFNPYNILAMRDNFRQGGADLLRLRRMLEDFSVPAANSPTGSEIKFDDHKVAFFGHSQGSLNGPNFLAVSPNTLGAVFSGAGGSLGPALLGKVEPVDIPALIILAMSLVPEEFDLDHPVIAAFQTFAEKADPLNYAQRFIHQPGLGMTPKHIFVSQGLLDEYALPEQAAAFAGAIGCSPIEPYEMPFSSLILRDRDALSAPVSGNIEGPDGNHYTAVLAQYPDDGHFAVFDNSRAIRQYLSFFESLFFEELPTVVE